MIKSYQKSNKFERLVRSRAILFVSGVFLFSKLLVFNNHDVVCLFQRCLFFKNHNVGGFRPSNHGESIGLAESYSKMSIIFSVDE